MNTFKGNTLLVDKSLKNHTSDDYYNKVLEQVLISVGDLKCTFCIEYSTKEKGNPFIPG